MLDVICEEYTGELLTLSLKFCPGFFSTTDLLNMHNL